MFDQPVGQQMGGKGLTGPHAQDAHCDSDSDVKEVDPNAVRPRVVMAHPFLRFPKRRSVRLCLAYAVTPLTMLH